MVTVYHYPDKLIIEVAGLIFEEHLREFVLNHFKEYQKVAEVDTDDLDQAFTLTNHINHSWHQNDKVKVIERSRSTSFADVFERDGQFSIVTRANFVIISLERS